MSFINATINNKTLTDVIGQCYKKSGNFQTVSFLDDLKDLGFEFAFKSGISIAINDIHIPKKKEEILEAAQKQVEDIQRKYDRHVLTEGERYNKVIDIWTHATSDVANEMFKELENDDQGFNPLFMMADSGARGSQDQIKQLAGMRGLMAKPKKSMVGASGEIIENPIKSNFKEGLSAFEYFISTHGARKGLADTALKTADAGYLTRRLVDVAQDVTITMEDCKTVQGILLEDLKEGEEIIEPLNERIIGRYSLEAIVDPIDNTIFVKKGVLLDEDIVNSIADSNVYQVKVRSVLTCEAPHGVCMICYGLNLASNKEPKVGDAVGIMAAQSIGEPGTQLTLRTFHIGGTASRIIEQSHIDSRREGVIKLSENLHLIAIKDEDGNDVMVASVRNGKMELLDAKGNSVSTWQVPYGSKVFVENGEKVKVGQTLFAWDPYTDVILARTAGIISFKDMIEGETYIEEAVESGKKMIVITESKNRDLSPHIQIGGVNEKMTTGGASILPVRATVIVRDGDKVKAGQVLVKIPRDAGKTRDITGGLPRIAELFEARNPANPAVITEIDGTIKYGKVKRGIREIHAIGKKKENVYKIPYGKHILVHEEDRVFAGDKLCEGAVSPKDILRIGGTSKVQEFLVNAIQEVYRLQGVAINDKHIEVIVRQMMQKVTVEDSGDTLYLHGDRINRFEIQKTNEELKKKVVIADSGNSDYEEGDVVYNSNVKDVNKDLKESGKKLIKTSKPKPVTFSPLLLGITRASLNTESFISAASFQETTRVLTDAAVEGKTDYLKGLKENVIIGRLIPAGTGALQNRGFIVTNPSDQEKEAIAEIDLPADESKQEELSEQLAL